ncbi:alpha/beta fold hydrolase [Nocardioides stalactiti]|uniref:alpha/beta fold hydrolase n=1 Tax=Nocardioides stalactiti TaxID=2755356 RepID=UPI001604614D|nr:alpha/beta fold hydrolase [Nocardioides stalactiti]
MLAYERFGTGEPLVLVHGISHRRQAWYPVAERLAEHREVILFDLPGHGESPELVMDGRPVKDVLQGQLIDFFDELGLEQPHIAGNSLGGRIALEAAADGLVSSATALAPAGFWKHPIDFAYIKTHFLLLNIGAQVVAPIAPTLAKYDLGRRLMLSSLMVHGENLDADRVVGDLHAMLGARTALRRIIAAGTAWESEIDPSIPVTIAWGDKDRVLLPHQAEHARRELPHADHVWLRGSGHVPMSDDVDSVVDVLLQGSSQGLRSITAHVA